jgi:hypothetical protein
MAGSKRVLTAAAALALCAAGARADFLIGQPIVVQGGPKVVSLRLTGLEAAWDGVLWLDADSSLNHTETPLFLNFETPIGTEIFLGQYEAGRRLDFIYDILTGQPNSFRTDAGPGIIQFGWEPIDATTIRVGVEEVTLPAGDHRYEDMQFEIQMTPVPTPAPAAAIGVLALLGCRRRRP